MDTNYKKRAMYYREKVLGMREEIDKAYTAGAIVGFSIATVVCLAIGSVLAVVVR